MKYKLKSVKFWVAVTLFVVGTTLVFLVPANSYKAWSGFMIWLAGFYFAGNVLSKKAKPTNINVSVDPSVPPEDNNAYQIIQEMVPPNEKCH